MAGMAVRTAALRLQHGGCELGGNEGTWPWSCHDETKDDDRLC